MVDYSLPLQVKQLDLPGAYGAAAQYSLNRAGADLRQQQFREAEEKRGALEDYAAAPVGDPRARDVLRAHPELYASTLANESATESAKLTANARAAMRVKGVADPAQRMQHWQEELDQAAREGRIPTLMHQRLRQTQPTDQLLDAIAGQAQAPLNDLQRAQAEHQRASAEQARAAAATGKYVPIGENVQGVLDVRAGKITPVGGVDQYTRQAEKAAAKEAGEALGKARVAFPEVMRSGNYMLDQIDNLIGNEKRGIKGDPYLDSVIGPFDAHPLVPTLRGKSQAAEAKIQQIQGGTFLKAFETLRGGGQITEAEGAKATAAFNRLSNTRQDQASWRAAASEFREEVVKLMRIARERASSPAIAPTFQPRSSVQGGQGQIPPEAVRLLRANASDPAIIRQFEDKYGVSAQQFLMQR